MSITIHNASNMHDGTFHGSWVVCVVGEVLRISIYVETTYLAIIIPQDGLNFLAISRRETLASVEFSRILSYFSVQLWVQKYLERNRCTCSTYVWTSYQNPTFSTPLVVKARREN